MTIRTCFTIFIFLYASFSNIYSQGLDHYLYNGETNSELISRLKKTIPIDNKIEVLLKLGFNQYKYNFTSGHSLAEISILLHLKHSDSHRAALNFLTGVENINKNNLIAAKHLYKALKYYEKISDTTSIILCDSYLISTAFSTHHYVQSSLINLQNHFNRINLIGYRSKNKINKLIYFTAYLNYFDYFYYVKKPKDYAQYIKEGLIISESLNGKYDFLIFKFYNSVGLIYSKNIDKKYALRYYKKAQQIFSKYNSKHFLILEYRMILNDENISNKQKLVLLNSLIKKLKYQNDDETNNELVATVNFMKYNIFFTNHDFENALASHHGAGEALSKEIRRKNSLYTDEINKYYITEIENERNKRITGLNNIYLYTIFITVFVFLGILLLYLRGNYFRKQLKLQIEERDDLYTIIGHNFNSPIITLEHLLLNLKNQMVGTKINNENINLMAKNISLLKCEVNNILSIYEESYVKYRRVDESVLVPLVKIIQNCIELHANSIYENLKTSVFVDPNILIKHGTAINIILTNIFSNALNHSKCQNMNISSKEGLKEIEIKILFDGSIMPNEAINFINGSNNSKLNINKKSFGLIMIKRFCDKIRCNVNVLSNEKGTLYTLRLKKT